MKSPIVIIGLGEMGGVFARGFLRLGHPVYPVTRDTLLADMAAELPAPELVLVAVAEGELQTVLQELPKSWAGRIGLLQNELLPQDWEGMDEPTVISVWFEKKPGMDYKVIIPSPAYGPHAWLLADALGALSIPVNVLTGQQQLLFELVLKNLYILTSNIAGLEVGGNVGELWEQNNDLARTVASEIIALQERLAGKSFDHEALIAAMLKAFDEDPAHKCMGRSAPVRLSRALEQAEQFGLELPTLRRIAQSQS